jgi:hypothetical protein
MNETTRRKEYTIEHVLYLAFELGVGYRPGVQAWLYDGNVLQLLSKLKRPQPNPGCLSWLKAYMPSIVSSNDLI